MYIFLKALEFVKKEKEKKRNNNKTIHSLPLHSSDLPFFLILSNFFSICSLDLVQILFERQILSDVMTRHSILLGLYKHLILPYS